MTKLTVQEPVLAVLRPLALTMHEIQVTLTLPEAAVATGAVLALPAWTPGSYLVRDYARFLDRLTVTDAQGGPRAVTKLDKQRWAIAPGAGPLTVTYRLFCNELTVRTNHVDASHGHLVGAATFLYLEGQGDRPWRIAFTGWPEGWEVATALPGDGQAYLAADHDTVVDSPFELGRFRLHAFTTGGAAFRLAITGEHPGDEAGILAATRSMVEAGAAIFGGFPFKDYLFLLTFSPNARGGLEHRDCTSLLADPLSLTRAEGRWDLYTLIAHEFFHVWNVKRMHDPQLGPFEYGRETPTRLLWFHEGFTSFMQYTIALRAGVVPWSWVAWKLGGSWTDNTTRAGRWEQSLEEASFDAWIRHYKPTEFTPNSTVSYYDKGALVGWMMDAELRLASGGAHGLDHLFRQLWGRAADGLVSDGILRELYRELTGKDPAPFWDAFIRGTAELEPQAIERAYGLSLTARSPWEALADGKDAEAMRRARVYSGLTLAADAPVIQNLQPGSPAAQAGLGYGMEVLAVAGWHTPSSQEAQQRLGLGAPGDRIEILAADRGQVRTFQVTLAENPQRTTAVAVNPKATPAQTAAFLAWTGQAMPGRRVRRPQS